MNEVTDKHIAAIEEMFAPYETAAPGEAGLILAKHCPDYTEAVRKLRAACGLAVVEVIDTEELPWRRFVQERRTKLLEVLDAALEATKEFSE